MLCRELDTPIGPLLLVGDAHALQRIDFVHGRRATITPPSSPRDDVFVDVVSQLAEYFEGRRRTFKLSLAPAGTSFQQRVWRALLDIAYGQTISYGELAERIGQPTASRAVGLANGSNPIPIVIPCHRVIGANGRLTGYGGGLPIKQRLLALEQGTGSLLD